MPHEIARSRADTMDKAVEITQRRMWMYRALPDIEFAIGAESEAQAWSVVMERYQVSSRHQLPIDGQLLPAAEFSSGEIEDLRDLRGCVLDIVDDYGVTAPTCADPVEL